MHSLIKYENKSASELLKVLELFSVPVDLDSLCEQLSVNKSTENRFFDNHSGEIGVEGNAVNIWINPLDYSTRQRFTLAHEIGHLMHDIIPCIKSHNGDCSFSDSIDNLRRDGRQDPKEYRVNDFAAKLLMPEELIMQHGKSLIRKMKDESGTEKVSGDKFIVRMAEEFQVSEQSMKIRLNVMGVL